MNPLNTIPTHFLRGINEFGVTADHFPDAVTKGGSSARGPQREHEV